MVPPSRRWRDTPPRCPPLSDQQATRGIRPPATTRHFRPAPEKIVQRRALLLLATAYFLAFGSVGVQMPLATPALLAAGLPAALVGLMWSVRSLAQVPSPTLWGALADRFGDARPFAMLSLGVGGLLLALVPFAPGEAGPIVTFALYGLIAGAAMTLLDGMTLTALGPEKRRYGEIRLFGAVGFGVTALAATWAVEAGLVEERAGVVFPLAGGLTVLAAVAVTLTPRLARPRLLELKELVAAVHQGHVLPLSFLGLLHWASHGAYAALVSPLGEARGAGRGLVGVGLLLAIVVEVVMMRLAGRLQERFGARRLLLFVVAITLLRWLGLAATSGPLSFVAWQALHGVSFGLCYPTLVSLVAARVPEEARQGAQGLFSSLFFGAGGALGAAVAGTVFEHRGEGATWLAMAALSSAALIVAVFKGR